MPNSILIQSISGAPPPYQIELCEPSFTNCVIVDPYVISFPYTISPIPQQFQNNPVQVVVTSLDPNYTGACEPNIIFTTPTPTPTQTSNPSNCFCYTVLALSKVVFTITNCNGIQQNISLFNAGDQIQVCSSTIPAGVLISVTQNGLCVNGVCPGATPTPTPTVTPSPTNQTGSTLWRYVMVQSPTPSVTQGYIYPTPTNTKTPTPTPSVTKTQTPTPTPSRSFGAQPQDVIFVYMPNI